MRGEAAFWNTRFDSPLTLFPEMICLIPSVLQLQTKKKKRELQEGRKQDINLVQGESWLWPHQQSFTLLCDLQICLACSVLVEDMSEGITVCCHCLWTSWENIIQKLLKPKPSACTTVCLRLRDWNTEAGQKRVEEPGLVVFYTIFPVLNCFQHC